MKIDPALLAGAEAQLQSLTPEERAEFGEIRARFEQEMELAGEADAKDFERGPWWVRGIDVLAVAMVFGLWLASRSQTGIWPWVMVIGGILLAFIVPFTARMIAASLSGAGKSPLMLEAITRFQEELAEFSARVEARRAHDATGDATGDVVGGAVGGAVGNGALVDRDAPVDR